MGVWYSIAARGGAYVSEREVRIGGIMTNHKADCRN